MCLSGLERDLTKTHLGLYIRNCWARRSLTAYARAASWMMSFEDSGRPSRLSIASTAWVRGLRWDILVIFEVVRAVNGVSGRSGWEVTGELPRTSVI